MDKVLTQDLTEYCSVKLVRAEFVEAHSPLDRLMANELNRTALRPDLDIRGHVMTKNQQLLFIIVYIVAYLVFFA